MSEKKRKLKNVTNRRPDKKVGVVMLSKEISKRTGFRTDDIKEVIKTAIDIIIEKMIKREAVVLPKIGMFYPYLKPSRVGTALHGGKKAPTKVLVPARWTLKFRPGNSVTAELLKISPTKEEVDNLYYDD